MLNNIFKFVILQLLIHYVVGLPEYIQTIIGLEKDPEPFYNVELSECETNEDCELKY